MPEAAPIHTCLPSTHTPLTLPSLQLHSLLKTEMVSAALVWLHMMMPKVMFKAQAVGTRHWSSLSGFRWP